ncbi:MAG: hypothetical protein RJB56_1055 [Actinomycetota bacterium]|jgi:lysophospholipase L1-like esterase
MESQIQKLEELLVGVASVRQTDKGYRFSRLPDWVQDRIIGDPILPMIAANGSGVRLRFVTRATKIRLKMLLTELRIGQKPRQPVEATAVVDGTVTKFSFDEVANSINIVIPDATRFSNDESVVELSLNEDTQHLVEIWLPQNCTAIITELEANADLAAAPSSKPKWVHYGSSISHGSEADGPMNVWPVLAASKLDLDIYNLGLAGQAHLDNFAARTVAELNPDFVSLKVGINSINANSTSARTYPHALHAFLDEIRDRHPEVPILVSTAIFCPPHEEGFGPTVMDPVLGKATASPKPGGMMAANLNLAIARDLTEKVVTMRRATDSNLYLMSGLDLFSADDAHDLPDDLHPNAAGHLRMAERFANHDQVAQWLGRVS